MLVEPSVLAAWIQADARPLLGPYSACDGRHMTVRVLQSAHRVGNLHGLERDLGTM